VKRAPAELLVVGRVATLADAGLGWTEALAVGDGRVLATGPLRHVEALAGRTTRTWRLSDDQAVLPALTDAHLHLSMLARARDQLDLSVAHDPESWLALVADAHQRRVAQGDDAGWLLGHGWAPAQMGDWPDAELLDRVAPGRPVALWAHDHHSRWLSSEALRRAGISAATGDPEGGVIRRRDDGEPSGVLHERAAGLVNDAIPEPDLERLAANLLAVAGDLAALGVVNCHDPGELDTDEGTGRDQLLYRRLAADGRLPLRVHVSIRSHHLDAALAAGMHSGERVEARDDDPRARRAADRFRMGWLKLFADGSLGSRSAALLEPYSDRDVRAPTGGPAGLLLQAPDELAAFVARASAGGIASQVHGIGDAAVRIALDILGGQPELTLRRRVEHAQLVDPADLPRFGQLGVAASVQPVHLRTDADIARAAWDERAALTIPLAGLDAGGALIPFGTDAPVEPIDPWPGIAVAVVRRDPLRPEDLPLGPRQAISLARAIRAACLDAALVAGEPDRGRLVAGHRADLIVVPVETLREPVDAAALAATRPLATLLDGEVVYRAPGFDA
jgi:predicted amidohydrolase YtcJ